MIDELQVCQNREVLAKFVVSASVQPSKIDEHCLRGISKDLIRDVINSSKYSNGLDSLSSYSNGGRTDDLIAGAAAVAAAASIRGISRDSIDDDYSDDIVDRLTDASHSHHRKTSSSSSTNSSSSAAATHFYDATETPRNNDENLCKRSIVSLAEENDNTSTRKSNSDVIEATKIPDVPERSIIMNSEPSDGHQTDEMGFVNSNNTVDSAGSPTPLSSSSQVVDLPAGFSIVTETFDDIPLSVSSEISALHDDNAMDTIGTSNLPIDDCNECDENDDNDVDRLMRSFANDDLNPGVPEISQVNVDELHNVEDFLQVISSMDGGDNVTDIAGDNAEDQPQASEIFGNTEGLSSFARELLNDVDVDVDVMSGLCTESVSIANISNIQPITTIESESRSTNEDLPSLQETAQVRQFEIERRCAFLLRRLRKLQARLVGRHVAEETTGILELAHHSVKKYFNQELANIGAKTGGRNFPQIGGSLKAFLERIEKTCAVQSNSVANRQRAVCRYFAGGSRDNAAAAAAASPGNERTHVNTVQRIPAIFGNVQVKIDGEEIENVAGSLAKQLSIIENNLDSDCTASSSGGESCDEMQSFNNPHQQTLPM